MLPLTRAKRPGWVDRGAAGAAARILPGHRCEMSALTDWFTGADPILQAFTAGVFTWSLTAAGAAVVLLRREFPRGLLDSMLGFAAGVMIAASFFSLLLPAVDMAEAMGHAPWLPLTVGFIAGAAFLRLADALLPHLHPFLPISQAEGIKTTWQRATLLVLAITLHNLPEGLAVGVAFAAANLDLGGAGGATLASAIALALGIGLQNFPEGAAVSMPLREAGVGRGKCFWYGQLSAVVEPLGAALGGAAPRTRVEDDLMGGVARRVDRFQRVLAEVDLVAAGQFDGGADSGVAAGGPDGSGDLGHDRRIRGDDAARCRPRLTHFHSRAFSSRFNPPRRS